MPIYKELFTPSHARISIWQIAESEGSLKSKLASVPSLIHSTDEIRHPYKKLQNLASRVALRHLLPKSNFLEINKDEHGKPFIQHHELYISFSHSGNMASAAVGLVNIGIDLQIQTEKVAYVQHKFLHESELDYCAINLPKLCQAWCIKEAAYKLVGKKGVSLKNDICIHPDLKSVRVRGTGFPVRYYLIDNMYHLAVVEDI